MQRSKFIAPVLLTVCLLLTSCVANVAYRQKESVLTPSPLHPHDGQKPYKLAFIEFDDLGELFDRTEVTRCLDTIRAAKANSPTGEAIVVVFVHGWKNNASDKSGNVWGFQEELEEVSNRAVSGDTPVVGVYMGWRGNVTNLPFAQDLTFWNRRDAAMRIPHAHITEAVHRIVNETKATTSNSSSKSICILVGHSFGGMVLERALTQSIVSLVLREESTPQGVQQLADLVVLVNEAAPATESKQFLDLLRTDKIQVRGPDGRDQPLLLSITSKGDLATGLAMPLGQYPSLLAKSPRVYDHPDPPSEKKQSTYYLHTTANMGVLQSHVIGRPSDAEVKQAIDGGGSVYKRFKLGKVDYVIVTKNPQTAWNTTPYWVMQMPVEFVPDHSTIFRPAFRQLLQQFLPAPEELKQPRSRSMKRVAIPQKPSN